MARKVLVVDKSLYNRMMLKDILIPRGYSVLEASSSDEAIDIYKQIKPDLVTVDASMPGMDGAKAVREIMVIDPDAAVLMCGTRGQRQLMMEGMTYGAEGVLIKPFNEKQVLRVVSQAISGPRPT